MKVNCVGGGPAGLVFALVHKKNHPNDDVSIYERNPAGARQGFGVVLSQGLVRRLAEADEAVHTNILDNVERWDDIDIHCPTYSVRCPGQSMYGISRETMIRSLVARCVELGVRLHFQQDVTNIEELRDADLLVAADGVNSCARDRCAGAFGTSITEGLNRFAWLGTTRTFDAFTFSFRESRHGLWWIHAYKYGPNASTIIVEGTAEVWGASGLETKDEAGTAAYFEDLFRTELEGHPLIVDRSYWRTFPCVRNERWFNDNVVLLGDAAHTAHFSIGSGMKIAVDGALELARALAGSTSLPDALQAYEDAHRPRVERTQRLGEASMRWFEEIGSKVSTDPGAFAKDLMNRAGVAEDLLDPNVRS